MTYFGKHHSVSAGLVGCGIALLLWITACSSSTSQQSSPSPGIDDFEQSALNALELRMTTAAMASLQAALGNYQALDDLDGQWRVHWLMARIHLSRGNAGAASESISAMEKLAPLIDEPAVYYHTGILVGQSRNAAGFEQALAHSTSGLQRAVAQTYMAQYELAINSLDHDGYDLPADRAFVYFRYGVYANSDADLQRALVFYKRAGDSRGIADSLLRLAAMSLQAGDQAGAQAYSQRALAVLTATGDTVRAESVQAWIEAQL